MCLRKKYNRENSKERELKRESSRERAQERAQDRELKMESSREGHLGQLKSYSRERIQGGLQAFEGPLE